jgi:hypothetical protein
MAVDQNTSPRVVQANGMKHAAKPKDDIAPTLAASQNASMVRIILDERPVGRHRGVLAQIRPNDRPGLARSSSVPKSHRGAAE